MKMLLTSSGMPNPEDDTGSVHTMVPATKHYGMPGVKCAQEQERRIFWLSCWGQEGDTGGMVSRVGREKQTPHQGSSL